MTTTMTGSTAGAEGKDDEQRQRRGGTLRMKGESSTSNDNNEHRKKRRRKEQDRDRRYYHRHGEEWFASRSGSAEGDEVWTESTSKPRHADTARADNSNGKSNECKNGNGNGNGNGSGSDLELSDNYVPPRPSKNRPYVPYTFDDSDDESRLPPASAHKHAHLGDEERFREKLFEAMADDEGGMDPFSRSAQDAGLSFDYRETLLHDRLPRSSREYGYNGTFSDRIIDPESGAIINRVIFKDAMTEDEYAEHVRRGMFQRTKREEAARIARLEAERTEREKKRAEMLARTRAMEAERIREQEERARAKRQRGHNRTREAYQSAWALLVDTKRTGGFRASDFPWPTTSIEDGGSMSSDSVWEFLTRHISNENENAQEGDTNDIVSRRKKAAIRTAVLAYHPDRFERYVLRVEDVREREEVRRMGLRVSQILNELLQRA